MGGSSFHAIGSLHLDMQLGAIKSVQRYNNTVTIRFSPYSDGEPSQLDIDAAVAVELLTQLNNALYNRSVGPGCVKSTPRVQDKHSP